MEHRRNLVARFAEKVGAITYWDLYSGPLPSGQEIVARMRTQFKTRPAMVNLSGLYQIRDGGINGGLRAIIRKQGMTVTEAEIVNIIANPSFFNKAKFYLNGRDVTSSVDRTSILEGE
jgi:hypothetical protein